MRRYACNDMACIKLQIYGKYLRRGGNVSDKALSPMDYLKFKCDKTKLVDISTVQIDQGKPREVRMKEFLRQIRNPYLFKVGDVIVEVSFRKNGSTLQKAMESLVMKNLGI